VGTDLNHHWGWHGAQEGGRSNPRFFFSLFFFLKNKKFNQVFTCQLLIGQRVSPLSQLTVNWTNLVTF
jgi:hypothetical protein